MSGDGGAQGDEGVHAMTVNVGDIVKFQDSGKKGEIGRVCKDNGVSVCVQFKSSGCLRVSKRDLEITEGKAPECSTQCKEGC